MLYSGHDKKQDSGKNYVTTQEENAYQKYHPKHFASPTTPDECEF